jgi:hypothetical protein
MDDVMTQLRDRINHIQFWYKLYADDLVVIVKEMHLEELIKTLKEVSTENSLIVNAKKSAIIVVKSHKALTGCQSVQEIPIVYDYRYLGILVDGRGEVDGHIDQIKQRSNYLRVNMRYYTHKLSFENQYLLWAIYVRPYLLYTAPIIESQNKGTQKEFYSLWKNSFKQFMGLPKATPNSVLERIFENYKMVTDRLHSRNLEKIRKRFGNEEPEV